MENSRNDGRNPKLQVLIHPNIGLDQDVRHSVVEMLNKTLANEAVLTMKTRRARWNVRGPDFFGENNLFASQYRQLNNISDEIAERTRILGGFAICSLGEFLKYSQMEEQPGIVPDVLHLLADHETCIRYLREDARRCSEDLEDEGTSTLIVDIMRVHEKMAMLLRSFIEPVKKQETGTDVKE